MLPRTTYPTEKASTVSILVAIPAWCLMVSPKCSCHILGLCGHAVSRPAVRHC